MFPSIFLPPEEKSSTRNSFVETWRRVGTLFHDLDTDISGRNKGGERGRKEERKEGDKKKMEHRYSRFW